MLKRVSPVALALALSSAAGSLTSCGGARPPDPLPHAPRAAASASAAGPSPTPGRSIVSQRWDVALTRLGLPPFGSPPHFLSFALDPATLLVLEQDSVVAWDVASRRVSKRMAFRCGTDALRGIFRTATDVFVMAGVVYRLTPNGPEEAGLTRTSGPRAFLRRDGSTVVCAADATRRCQGHFVFAKGQARLGTFAWSYVFPLAAGMGFHEGPSAPSGSDLGVSRMTPHQGLSPLERTWVRDVDLWWTVPAEDGGVILTMEGQDRLHRKPFLRRVTSDGAHAPCALGDVPLSRDVPLALAPDGKTAAVPLADERLAANEGNAVMLVDVDACTGRQVALPARPLSTDFSPDGRTLAVGLADRTVVLVPAVQP